MAVVRDNEEHIELFLQNFNDDSSYLTKYVSQSATIFFLNSPRLYFMLVDVQMMSVAFYMSMWVSNFSILSTQLPESGSLWVVVTLIPGVLGMIFFVYCFEQAVLLKGIVDLIVKIVSSSCFCFCSLFVNTF